MNFAFKSLDETCSKARDLMVAAIVLFVFYPLAACNSEHTDVVVVEDSPDPSGPGGAQMPCTSLSGGSTVAALAGSCSTCTADQLPLLVDGDFDTVGVATVPSNAMGDVILMATAQSGVVFPEGTTTGGVYEIDAGSQVGFQVEFQTYLGGSVQESYVISSSGTGGGTGGKVKTTFDAAQQFDGGCNEFCVLSHDHIPRRETWQDAGSPIHRFPMN